MIAAALPAVLCDVCVDPGRCCKDLSLSDGDGCSSFSMRRANSSPLAASVEAAKHFLPFIPVRAIEVEDAENGDYVHWRMGCVALTDRGRCSIYEDRPALCREYKAASDGLCVYGNREENHAAV